MPIQSYLAHNLQILCHSAQLLVTPGKSIDLDDDHQKYFCRSDRAEKNLWPKQCLFSLVLCASALLSVCMDSTESSSFAVWRCRVHCWLGRVCLHPQNVPVLEANSTPGKAAAWGWGQMLHAAGNQVLSQGFSGEHNVRPCAWFSVFFSLSGRSCLHHYDMKCF